MWKRLGMRESYTSAPDTGFQNVWKIWMDYFVERLLILADFFSRRPDAEISIWRSNCKSKRDKTDSLRFNQVRRKRKKNLFSRVCLENRELLETAFITFNFPKVFFFFKFSNFISFISRLAESFPPPPFQCQDLLSEFQAGRENQIFNLRCVINQKKEKKFLRKNYKVFFYFQLNFFFFFSFTSAEFVFRLRVFLKRPQKKKVFLMRMTIIFLSLFCLSFSGTLRRLFLGIELSGRIRNEHLWCSC